MVFMIATPLLSLHPIWILRMPNPEGYPWIEPIGSRILAPTPPGKTPYEHLDGPIWTPPSGDMAIGIHP